MSWTGLDAKVILLSLELFYLKNFSAGQLKQNEDTFCCPFFGYCWAPWRSAFYCWLWDCTRLYWNWSQIFWTLNLDDVCSSPSRSSPLEASRGPPSMTCWAIFWQCWDGSHLSWNSHSLYHLVEITYYDNQDYYCWCRNMAFFGVLVLEKYKGVQDYLDCWGWGWCCRHNPQIPDLARCWISIPVHCDCWWRTLRGKLQEEEVVIHSRLSPVLKQK